MPSTPWTTITSLLGVTDGDLLVPVQACIAALMDEVERLRNELAQVRRRRGDVARSGRSSSHPPGAASPRLPARILTKLLAQGGRSGLGGTVLHLHIVGIEALRDAQGPKAAEAALAKAIEILRSETEPADALG